MSEVYIPEYVHLEQRVTLTVRELVAETNRSGRNRARICNRKREKKKKKEGKNLRSAIMRMYEPYVRMHFRVTLHVALCFAENGNLRRFYENDRF